MTLDHAELRASVRSALNRAEGPAILAGQLGAYGLAVPEEHGGLGCTLAETQVVCEEVGRVLAPVPFLSSAVLAAQALLLAGAHEHLPALAEGTLTGTVAWAEDGSWDAAAIRAEARDGRLYGVKDHVLDAPGAGLVVVPARFGGDLALFAVTDAAVEALPVMDQTRPQSRIVFDGTPATLLAADAAPLLDRLLAVAATALAGEQLGGAQYCLDMTVEYVRTRKQFGRPIGSFQAVKHRLADVYVLVESARSLGRDAARALAADAPDAERRAATAQAYCAEAFQTAAAETIQLHGGIGFTWEHPAHRYFKRAHGSAQLFGTPAWHRQRIAETVLPGC
ncbi:acyl-CoA dehydrogenase family protein [Actinomadura flavalba]|uniref:acyl-CoA dehydrogenase family protein n=1 Tax=Actinomadura flavalba TaxID=1120938 RepID=UPI00036F2E97|nr:acyl-CoA dehydrogenase family protein [Actinomadura flavalba]